VRDPTFLLVQRYARAGGDDGNVRRIHQEDFCQAPGVPPETKYASEGGPTFKDCFGPLRSVAARPAVDVLKLLDAVIFNVIAGNADVHGKNFSILHDGEGVLAVARELYALSLSFTEFLSLSFLVFSRHQKALRLGLSRAENPVVTSQPLA
jgi:HipA-like C-terminal domain